MPSHLGLHLLSLRPYCSRHVIPSSHRLVAMDVDQQPASTKRRRIDIAVTPIIVESTTNSSPVVVPSAPASSTTPLPSRPAVLRGRPPIVRSTDELHAAAARYLCSVCGKVLQNAYKLERHGRTHTGDLPFACAVCGAQFSDQHNANRHQRTCRQRKRVEQAMQTIRLSWPLWREQPDEEEEEEQEDEEEAGIDKGSSSERNSQAGAEDVAGLPRLNRWLFPQRYDAADDAGP